VIDLGCGEGKLELSLREKGFKNVTSYDLVKIAQHVVECDIKTLPEANGAAHAAVFCLSLMGTNYIDFLIEANRVLAQGGLLLIAEVSSRFTSIQLFKALLSQLGFQLLKHVRPDSSNKLERSEHSFQLLCLEEEVSSSAKGRITVRIFGQQGTAYQRSQGQGDQE
jgi:ribosomal RNA-processing protein 8